MNSMTDERAPAVEHVRSGVVIDEAGCWIWQRRIEHHGYARTYFRGRNHYVHRLAYQALVAPIPAGLQIDHLCRVRACCNPEHLEVVTARENILRAAGPRTESQGGLCRNGQHELTPENVRETSRGRRCAICHQAKGRRKEARRGPRNRSAVSS
jgi:hypothetical protein